MKVLNVSKFVLSGEQRRRRRDRAARSRHAAESRHARGRGDRRARSVRIRAGAGEDRVVLLGFLRQLRRSGEVAHAMATSVPRRRHRPPPRCGWRCRCCCGCWRRTCRLRAKRCGRGPMPDRSIAPPGRRVMSSSACRAPTQSAQQAVIHITEALNAIRKGKVDQKVSIGTPVSEVVYSSTDEAIACLTLVERDLKAAVAHRQPGAESRPPSRRCRSRLKPRARRNEPSRTRARRLSRAGAARARRGSRPRRRHQRGDDQRGASAPAA